jgi:hypothetical protein
MEEKEKIISKFLTSTNWARTVPKTPDPDFAIFEF